MTDTGELERLRVENERLRAVLNKIFAVLEMTPDEIQVIVRAALEGKG